MSIFHRIGIIGKKQHSETLDTLHNLITVLQQHTISIFLEKETAEMLDLYAFPIYEKEELGEHCDVFIIVGGDGSLLTAAPFAAKNNVPVIGINRGRLGFLTDIRPDELSSKLQRVLNGEYIEEQRLLLETHVENHKDIALNEVLITSGPSANMLEFETYINKQFVCNQRADGIIISTPTGSTAYALSANGPIVHPQMNALTLIPMLPHTLSSRPLVIDSKNEITIRIVSENPVSALLSCDGKERITLPPGSTINIKSSSQKLRLIHPIDYNYYDTLRTKLHWEKKNS